MRIECSKQGWRHSQLDCLQALSMQDPRAQVAYFHVR